MIPDMNPQYPSDQTKIPPFPELRIQGYLNWNRIRFFHGEPDSGSIILLKLQLLNDKKGKKEQNFIPKYGENKNYNPISSDPNLYLEPIFFGGQDTYAFLFLSFWGIVLILDGNSLRGAHVRHYICYSTCSRHLITSRTVTNRVFSPKKAHYPLCVRNM